MTDTKDKGAPDTKGKGDGTDTAQDTGRDAGPQYPLDPSRPPINPETRRVPVARGIPAPTILDPREEDGVIPASAPVWEGGDPGVAVMPDPTKAQDVDQTYWPEADTPPVEETPEPRRKSDRDDNDDPDDKSDTPARKDDGFSLSDKSNPRKS